MDKTMQPHSRCLLLFGATLVIVPALAHTRLSAQPANDCQISYLVTNGIFTHGSMICNEQWLDRPASIAIAEASKLCRSLGEAGMMPYLRRGMEDFDRAVNELGRDAACQKLDDNMKKVEGGGK